MHIILGLLALAGAAYFWLWRARNAAEMTGELLDAAREVRLAARRFGFRRKTNVHPADSIDDPCIAASGILNAMARDLGPLTEERRNAIIVQTQSVFDISKTEAEELALLGQWMAEQCGTPASAVSRLSRKLRNLAGADALPDMERMIAAVFGSAETMPPETDAALNDLRRVLRP